VAKFFPIPYTKTLSPRINTDFHGKYRNLKYLNSCIKFREISCDSVAKFFPIPYTKTLSPRMNTDFHGKYFGI
jgi:hypothetical protein